MSYDPDAKIVAGDVCFAMHFPDGQRTVRASGMALSEYFGADRSEQGLLDAYRANFRAIHAIAQQMGTAGGDETVVTAEALHAAAASAPKK